MECPACHAPNTDARFCAKCGALLPAAGDEGDPLIGSVVGGRFRITGVLGEGGMGRVYNGEQQMGTSVRKVAVKTLLAQYAKDPQVLARFMRECGTVSELEHPNTIKVYDFGQTNTGELYIAMELLNGQSLEKTLERGPLNADRADRIVGQICGSLEEAHAKGIVHRDLKPANIYLTTRGNEDDVVKVLDFGIAKKDEKHSKQEAKLTQQGTVLGTPPYMSPEQFKGLELDARSDIYSLGVMTYEMLTGRLPFDADTPWAWATQHMTAQPFPFETIPLGTQVPPKMKAAVMRALSKDRDRRPQSVREFYDELTMGASRQSSAMIGPAGTSVIPRSSGFADPATGAGYASPSYRPGPPTVSGQSFAPPAARKPNTILVAAGAIVGVCAVIVLGVLAFRNNHGGSDVRDAGLPIPTGATSVTPDTDPTTRSGFPTPSHGGSTFAPPVNRECDNAIEAARMNKIFQAVNHYQACDNAISKAAAKTAIDAAAQREAASKGCGALNEAKKAASIGARTALEDLRAQKCKRPVF